MAAAHAQSAADLLRRAIDYDQTQQTSRDKYVYHEHVEHKKVGSDGRPSKLNFTRDYEWMVAGGGPFRRLVQMDGKPLDAKRARQEEARMHMTAAERNAEARANPKQYGLCYPCVEDAEVLRSMNLTLQGEDTVNDRKAWVILAQAPANPSSMTLAQHFKITYWIDEEDSVIARVRYEQLTQGGSNQPGSWEIDTRVRLADGNWFLWRVEMIGRTDHYWFQIHTFSNIRQFGAESKILYQ
jgi:hypothetical protein